MAYEIKIWNGGNPTYNRQPRIDIVKYIAIHYTADGTPNSHTAKNSMIYFSGGNRNASAHFFIDDYEIWEYADPVKWSCWHVGDGHGKYGITNQNSIGIEVVQNSNAPFSAEEIRKLAWLVKKLMKQFNIPASRVVRHYDASRKVCPWYYTPSGAGGDKAWKALHSTITKGIVTPSSASTVVPAVFGGTYKCTVEELNVRDKPSLDGKIITSYHKDDTVVLDDWYKSSNGLVWGRYKGQTSGKMRYVAIGRDTGKVESDDFLVRV